MKRKQDQKNLDKVKDQEFANLYKKNIEGYNDKHDQIISTHKGKINSMLDKQSNHVIIDANEDRKKAAVNNMKESYERAERLQNNELSQNEKDKKHELQETSKIL